jgi:hypothetical protein
MLDFVEQLQGESFPGKDDNHPTALLEGLAENTNLNDAAMTGLFGRLLQLGAKVDEDIVTFFVVFHPRHEAAYKTLYAATQEPDVKEPAECQQ